jgi:hypothetical protein
VVHPFHILRTSPSHARRGPAACRRKCILDDRLGFHLDAMQMFLAKEAFHVYLVYVFGPRRSRREPAALRTDLQPTYRCIVPGGPRKYAFYLLTGQNGRGNLIRRESCEGVFLISSRRRLYPVVHRFAELRSKILVYLPGVSSHPRRDFRREQGRDNTILVSRPNSTITAKK